jgi:methionyl-tRNA synthetase
VTRDLDWELMFQLKVPKEKIIIWFDAPIGYISSTKEWALREGKIGNLLEDKDTKLVHFIGKDNIVFHYHLPAMLKAEGSYILPDNVPAMSS